MRGSRLLALVILLAAGCAESSSDGEKATNSPASLSQLHLDPALFGAGWRVSPSLALDHWDDVEALADDRKATVEVMRSQMEPLGVIALGDFSCARTDPPPDLVTVRVFLFENAIACEEWRDRKYQHPGWEEYYRSVEGLPYFAVDSTQTSKPIVVLGRYWITAHQSREGELHLRALESITAQLGVTEPG